VSANQEQKLGQAGEETARRFLKGSGYQILARNFRCPVGEIDLICREAKSIVFVEVKTRSDDALADPETNINPSKQRRMERAAKVWLSEHRWPDCAYRFDAVSVIMPLVGEARVRHIREAFVPTR
jgi:putative endonuclease